MQQKSRDQKGREHLLKEIIGKLDPQNESYKPFLKVLNFNFDDLSKTSRDSVEQISEISQLLKVRFPDDTAITSSLFDLINEETNLRSELRDLKNENRRYDQVLSGLDKAIKDWEETSGKMNKENENFVQFKKDANDRVEDILKPKNFEYQTTISATDV